MHKIISNLESVQNRVNKILAEKKLNTSPKIIVVTKTFSLDYVRPLVNSGYTHFGENKVQEAINKWEKEKNEIQMPIYVFYPNLGHGFGAFFLGWFF